MKILSDSANCRAARAELERNLRVACEIVNAKRIRIPKLLFFTNYKPPLLIRTTKTMGLSAIPLQDSLSNIYRIPHQYTTYLSTNVDLAIDPLKFFHVT